MRFYDKYLTPPISNRFGHSHDIMASNRHCNIVKVCWNSVLKPAYPGKFDFFPQMAIENAHGSISMSSSTVSSSISISKTFILHRYRSVAMWRHCIGSQPNVLVWCRVYVADDVDDMLDEFQDNTFRGRLLKETIKNERTECEYMYWIVSYSHVQWNLRTKAALRSPQTWCL